MTEFAPNLVFRCEVFPGPPSFSHSVALCFGLQKELNLGYLSLHPSPSLGISPFEFFVLLVVLIMISLKVFPASRNTYVCVSPFETPIK